MKKTDYKAIYLLLLLSLPFTLTGQDCVDYHNLGDCMMDKQKGYKTYSQSKSISLSANDTAEINLVFYGQKDYILSFCTHRKMYPIHFWIIDPGTGEVIYDNKEDKYLESLGVGFDATKPLTFKVSLLARKADESEIKDFVACMGLLIQYKNYEKKTVELQM